MRLDRAVVCVIAIAGCAAAPPPSEETDRGRDGDGLGDHGKSDDSSPIPTADELRAAVSGCPETVGGPFASDANQMATLSVCRQGHVLHWTADMDIDCDGKETAECNLSTDPYFQNQTSAVDSMGDPLDSAALPFVVVPSPSERFDYRAAGLAKGSVFAVLYGDRVEYGVIGDTGPVAIIGEASYAMAVALGIDPDPSTGGIDSGVTYIGFTGEESIVGPIEDHGLAVSIGIQRARELLGR